MSGDEKRAKILEIFHETVRCQVIDNLNPFLRVILPLEGFLSGQDRLLPSSTGSLNLVVSFD
jgi:hypothetical protein